MVSVHKLQFFLYQTVSKSDLVLLERVGSAAVPLVDGEAHVENEHIFWRQARLGRRYLPSHGDMTCVQYDPQPRGIHRHLDTF